MKFGIRTQDEGPDFQRPAWQVEHVTLPGAGQIGFDAAMMKACAKGWEPVNVFQDAKGNFHGYLKRPAVADGGDRG